MLADLHTYPWKEPLLPFGIGVAVIAWLLFRTEPRLRAIEKSVDRLTKAVLMWVMAAKHGSAELKKEAQHMQNEIDIKDHKEDK
jgi:hypothetical protein